MLQFKPLDASGNVSGDCYTQLGMSSYSVSDVIKSSIGANSQESGYLYCTTSPSKMQVTAVTAADEKLAEQGTLKATATNVFYVNI